MPKTLIIAEKSTQMREYARALGFTLKGDHYEKGDTILSCAAGHLLDAIGTSKIRDTKKPILIRLLPIILTMVLPIQPRALYMRIKSNHKLFLTDFYPLIHLYLTR